MVINVWHKDNPPLALSLGEFFYEWFWVSIIIKYRNI
jgi:hypothetical protein